MPSEGISSDRASEAAFSEVTLSVRSIEGVEPCELEGVEPCELEGVEPCELGSGVGLFELERLDIVLEA